MTSGDDYMEYGNETYYIGDYVYIEPRLVLFDCLSKCLPGSIASICCTPGRRGRTLILYALRSLRWLLLMLVQNLTSRVVGS